MKRFDKDGDGKLSEEERAAARAARPPLPPMAERSPEARKQHVEAMLANPGKRILDEYDADKDGKLNDVEKTVAMTGMVARMEEQRKRMMEKMDTNKDGKIDEAERAAGRQKMEERRRGKKRGGPKGEEGGEPNRAEMLKKFDEDKDGKLNEAERAKAREAALKPADEKGE